MSAADNKALVLRYFLESHNPPYNLTVIPETCTSDYARQQLTWHSMERSAFPDEHFAIDDAIAEGDRVVVGWHFRGTHVGPFWTPVGSIAGTGNLLQDGATLIYRVEQGRVAEEWTSADWLAVILQLGGMYTVPGPRSACSDRHQAVEDGSAGLAARRVGAGWHLSRWVRGDGGAP